MRSVMPHRTAPAKISTDVTVMTIIAAIVAAFGAFAIFRPKLAIAAAMKRETGSVEPAFRWLYVVPQYVNILLIAGLCLALIGGFIHSLDPRMFAQHPVLARFGAFFVIENIVWILFWAALIGAVVQFNWLSWILLVLTRVASYLPVPRLQGAFGSTGQSAGWLQAMNICRAWDNGQPLLLRHERIDRVADAIFFRLSQPGSGAGNFAATPINAALDARANIALFGCILESTHYVQGWALPKWSEFYAALAAIHDQVDFFDPKELRKFASGDKFATALRAALVAEISARAQPVPEDKYLAGAGSLATTWDRLSQSAGSVLNLIPSWAGLLGGRLYWLDKRLSKLPMLNTEGMRPQLIKLLARWQAIPWVKTSVFVQPFAKKQGWHLLQETALGVFPEQKDVTYFSIGDVQLTRIACVEVVQQVSAKVRRRQSDEAKYVDKEYPTEWDLFAAADYSLWNLASEREAKGRAENWDAAKGWLWKLENGRVSRTS